MRKYAAVLTILALCVIYQQAYGFPKREMDPLRAQDIAEKTVWEWPLSSPDKQDLDAGKLNLQSKQAKCSE